MMTSPRAGRAPVGRAARAQQRWADLGGPVHYLDFGGPRDAPVIVCVHGLAGSALNWSALAPLLTDRFRVLAPDLAGHGLTRSAGRGVDVVANRTLLHDFIDSVPARPVILMGNSMGGMISLLEAGASPTSISGLILVDPALPFLPAVPDPLVAALFALYMAPGIGHVLAAGRRRLSPEAAVYGLLALCCADPSRVPGHIVAQHVELGRQRVGYGEIGRELTIAMRSVVATVGFLGGQEYRRQIQSITCPVLLLHGACDRLIPATAARAFAKAHQDCSLVILPGVGHLPQLEASQDCAAAISQWFRRAGGRRASAPSGRAGRTRPPPHR
jgi:pimeloyl-ACP methyl ester carboxylesterase